MKDHLQQFADDAQTLELTAMLVDYAVAIGGDKDVGSILIGAAIRLWKREMGDEHALNLARIALATIIEGIESPSQRN